MILSFGRSLSRKARHTPMLASGGVETGVLPASPESLDESRVDTIPLSFLVNYSLWWCMVKVNCIVFVEKVVWNFGGDILLLRYQRFGF